MTNEDIVKLMRTLGQTVDQMVQSITTSLQKLVPAFHGATEAFKELGRLGLSPRSYRKVVRWEEKNRRRHLKGLPEQPCPYRKEPDNFYHVVKKIKE